MKILLRLPLSPYSGYGNDGIGLTRALVRWGADVYLDPVLVQSPIPEDIALLLTKTLEAPFDLTIVHEDPGALKLSAEQKRSSKIAVGWTMWEWSDFGAMPGRSKLRDQWKNFDALIGYDPVSSGALAGHFSKKKPVLTLQGGYDPEPWEYVERDWFGDRFGFAMNGQLHDRKNPFVAIQAFQELKSDPDVEFEGAELHLHTTSPGLHSAMEKVIPKLRIHYVSWPQEIVKEFYAAQHVLLAPSRGEGKNLPALEMQSTGGVAVATNWGGHTMWLNPEYSFPLDYTLSALDPASPTTMNASASTEHLKQIMLYLYQNRAEAKRMGTLASNIIPKMCSWDAVVERLFLSLKEKVPGGEALFSAAQSCRVN